jgi:hypothetical protein
MDRPGFLVKAWHGQIRADRTTAARIGEAGFPDRGQQRLAPELGGGRPVQRRLPERLDDPPACPRFWLNQVYFSVI